MAAAPFAGAAEHDAVKEGMYEWVLYILQSEAWEDERSHSGAELVQALLEKCLLEPGVWSLKLAGAILDGGEGVRDREAWRAVLDAAGNEDMLMEDVEGGVVSEDVDMIETARPVSLGAGKSQVKKEKIQGPQKVLGLWRPRPIGWLPDDFEDDE